MNATVYESPVGPLRLEARDGALVALHLNAQPGPENLDDPVLAGAVEQLRAYFAGERTSFELPLETHGNAFEERVWAALREIPYGETASYGEIARRIGAPGAARAVGLANGRNPIAIVVPCHRVIGANGKLVGFGGGLPMKRALLDLERGIGCLDGVPHPRDDRSEGQSPLPRRDDVRRLGRA
jgi:methylated-DNA-[protein]-cysteine S-methyltransferase